MRLSTSHVGTSNRGCTPIALYPFGLHTEAKGGACATCAHAPAGDLCRRPNMGDHRRLRMLGALHAQTWVLPGTLWSTANQFAAVTMTVSERSTKSLASVRFWNCTSITGESWRLCEGALRRSRCGDVGYLFKQTGGDVHILIHRLQMVRLVHPRLFLPRQSESHTAR